MATSVGTINVKATLDSSEFKKGVKEVENDGDKLSKKQLSAAEKMEKSFADGFKSIAKKSAVAFGAAGGAIAGFAVKGYADFEQLTGGIDKLFGDAANSVMKNAKDAFKTAGLSANDYMESVTNFSASLIAGLNGDTAKAAAIADVAIRDMSDNANTFGTSMSSIQYAYQGFAKQNYSMLDNLKLGYGGTASEMARLVNESGVLGESVTVDARTINSVSFDKIIEAINITQQRLGLTGTTSKEAAGTVSGSFNSMKSAAENFMTALGGGGDVNATFNQLVDSAKTFAGNLVPVFKEVVDSIIGLFGDMWTDFEKNHPVISTAIESISILVGALLIPKLAVVLGQTVKAGVSALVAGGQMMAGWLMALGPVGLVVAAIGGIIGVFVLLWNKFDWFREGVMKGLQAIGNFFKKAWEGITDAASATWEFLSDIFTAVWDKVVSVVTSIKDAIFGFFTWINNNIIMPIYNFVANVVILIVALVTNFITMIYNIIMPIVTWIYNVIILPVINFISGAISTIVSFVKGMVDTITTVVGVIVDWISNNIINPIVGFFQGLWDSITNGVNAATDTIRNVFNSVKDFIDKTIVQPIAGFFKGLWDGITGGLNAAGGAIRSTFDGIVGFVKAPINGIISAINSVIDTINGITVPDWVPVIGGSHTDFPHVPTLATGGLVGGVGTATSDSNPAMLSRGEYVVNARAVKALGIPALDEINRGRLPGGGANINTTNYYYQFDQQANNRWMYQQVKTGAAA